MTQFLKRFWLEKQAETLPEYALLLILISLTALAGIKGVATTINHYYSRTSSQVAAVSGHPSITTNLQSADNRINSEDTFTRKEKMPPQN